MKRSRPRALRALGLVALGLLVSSLPAVAHACPGCFSGGNANDRAFLWGSLFMMAVPVLALGTLFYLAYKRIRTVDERNAAGLPPRTEPAPIADGASDPRTS